MNLSEYERKILDEIESTFEADDPGLAALLRFPSQRVRKPLDALLGGLITLCGLVLIAIGLTVMSGVGPFVAIAGFAATVTGCDFTVRAIKRSRRARRRMARRRS